MMMMMQLLEKHFLATEVVREWFMAKMLESMKDELVPENFKEFMREQGIPNDRLVKLFESNPRVLFDVFDENGLMIEISISNTQFSYKIFPRDVKFLDVKWYDTRKEAEYAAVTDAFLTLNNKLNEDRPNSGSSDSEVPTEE